MGGAVEQRRSGGGGATAQGLRPAVARDALEVVQGAGPGALGGRGGLRVVCGERGRELGDAAPLGRDGAHDGRVHVPPPGDGPSVRLMRRSFSARSAPSQSALLTTSTSATWELPALMTLISSPSPGTSTTAVVCATRTT